MRKKKHVSNSPVDEIVCLFSLDIGSTPAVRYYENRISIDTVHSTGGVSRDLT